MVIPDVNTKERLDWGGEPQTLTLQTALAKLHLGLLARLDKGETLGLSWAGDVKGKLDLSRIVTVGHSSGGGYVVDAAQLGALPNVKATVTVALATHIGTLHGGGSNEIGPVNPPTTPGCRPAALLAKPTQRAQLAQLTADFLSQALRGDSAYILHTVPGASLSATSQTTAATVAVAASPGVPAQVDPKSVVYTRSPLRVLPPKPASLVLFGSNRDVV